MELSLVVPSQAIDPVCGMSVDPATAKGSHHYEGRAYHFCSVSCLKKFQADPQKYLAGQRDPHEVHATPAAATLYICPMDTDVVSDRPGACPKCGMALEPATPTLDDLPDPETIDMTRRLWVSMALGIPLLSIAMLDMTPAHPMTHLLGSAGSLILQWLLCTPIVLWCARPFFARAGFSWQKRNFNMFTLISLGVSAAYLFSTVSTIAMVIGAGMIEPYFESAAAIVALVLAGQVLELRARRKTGDAIRALLNLSPKTARLIVSIDREEDVAVELLQPGDRIRIRPGERVPVDGIAVEGSTHVDESMLTGEPLPVAKAVGSNIAAGTLNGEGTIVVETKKTGNDTLLGQVVRLVGEAQRSRMPVQALVDRVAAWFVPIVLVIAVVTLLAWLLFDPTAHGFTQGLINGVSVLIVACPCALGLATPMAVVVGMGRGAALGVLFRNAETLERFRRIDTIVFDKTGTLTAGKPELVSVEPAEGQSVDELLRLAAGLELTSEHPLAAAIVKAAESKGLSLATATDVTVVPGRGIRGSVQGRTVMIGNRAFLDEAHINGEASRRRLEDLREEGNTVVQVAIGDAYAGLIAIGDPIRPSTPGALSALKLEGVKLIMLTGDSRTTANAVARKVGVDDVIAEVLPTDKHEQIRELQAEGRLVAMAGDGINDAAALAQADVGIALGSGADVAIESAEMTLIRPDLNILVSARQLSRATMRTIRQNLLLAFLYNVLAIPVAAGVLVPLAGIAVGPIWSAAAMSFSSLSVIGNSLRLRRRRLGG